MRRLITYFCFVLAGLAVWILFRPEIRAALRSIEQCVF